MKNSLLLLCGLLVLINTTAGLVIESYPAFNMAMGDISLILSAALYYVAYSSEMADGFKIGYTLLLAITGLGRFICAAVAEEAFKNNVALFLFVVLLSAEILFLFVANSLKGK
jgi:hypothetical protein